jgi:hypothetical protein
MGGSWLFCVVCHRQDFFVPNQRKNKYNMVKHPKRMNRNVELLRHVSTFIALQPGDILYCQTTLPKIAVANQRNNNYNTNVFVA